MGKIVFYQDRSFQGHCYQCSTDHPDLQSYLKQCNFSQVEKGSGTTYMSWMTPHSAPSPSQHLLHTTEQLILFERDDLQGQMLELTDDCPTVQDCIHYPEIHSLNVLGGSWILYELPNFGGRLLDWGAVNAKVGSLRRMVDLH
uniref:Beta/gamma crystallin 'Greek key' domain-containing protein n=1 Tax=Terrapene triunguis TaxID=2587831 RepID=A0A674I0U0_9SAUR